METSLDEQSVSLIEEHVRRLLSVMGFAGVKVHCTLTQEQSLSISIEAGEEGRMLIGAHGGHLLALQHLIRCLIRRHIREPLVLLVDVNGYRSRREQSLLSLAEEMARKANHTGRTVVLAPMNAADRRAIHTALAHRKDVRTESLGMEPNRRVVVKPVFL